MKKHAVIVAILLLCVSCAASNQFMVKKDITGAQIPKPSEGKAMVVFVRPSSLAFAISFRVYDGENLIGVLRANTYFPYETTPGKHLFGSMSENYAFLEAELAPNKTYYILGRVYMGLWKARTEIRPIKQGMDIEKLPEWLADVNLIQATEDAYAWDKGHAESVKSRRDKYYKDWLESTDKHVLKPEDGI